MTLPNHTLSSVPVIDPYLEPDDRDRGILVDYEIGGVALYDTSLGIRYQNWKLTYVGGEVLVTPDDTGIPISLFAMAGISECSLAFDKNMNPFIAYVVSGQSWIWWYDTEVGTQVHTPLPVAAYSPRCALDDKRRSEEDTSDVILAYMMGSSLYTREQRDRFGVVANVMTTPDATEYLMLENVSPDWNFNKIGMGEGNRFLFTWLENFTGSTQDPEEIAATLELVRTASETGWIDLSLLPQSTFLEVYGSEVWDEDFTRVIQTGSAAAVMSVTDDVRISIVHAPIDANEVIALVCNVNGGVSGGLHYIGYELPQEAYLPLQRNLDQFVIVASDTGNARMRKQDFTIQEGYPYNLYMYSNPLTKVTVTPDLQGQKNMSLDPEVVFTMDGDGLMVVTALPVVYSIPVADLDKVSLFDPIEFIAGSSYNTSTSTGNKSIPVPAGTAEGDLVIVTGNTRNSYMTSLSGGEPFTELDSFGVPTGSSPVTGNEELRTWWKICGPSEPANWTMGYTDSGTNALTVQCLTLRNAKQVRSFAAGIDTQTMPSQVAVAGDALVSAHGTCFDSDDETGVGAPGMTLVDAQKAPNSVGNAIAYLLDLPDGATGTINWTGNWNGYAFATSILIENGIPE